MIDITSQLILDKLSAKWTVQLFGPKPDIPMKVPMLYSPEVIPESGRIYISSPEYLPEVPRFPKDALLICTSGQRNWAYTKGRFPMVRVECDDLWAVFNTVQAIFDRYNQWACMLDRLIDGNADLIEMVKCSLPIFENRIAILDRDMYHLALTEMDEQDPHDRSKWVVRQSPPLEVDKIGKYMDVWMLHRDSRELFSPYPGTYTRNLFVSGRHEGFITIGTADASLTKSDLELFHFLADRVEKALVRHADLAASSANSLKLVFRDLLAQKPVSTNRLRQIRSRYQIAVDQNCICITLYRAVCHDDFPVQYICTMLEKLLEGCIAMDFEPCITAIVCLKDASGLNQRQQAQLEKFLMETGFQAGVSYVFSDIRAVRTYYHQACSAYEFGAELDPGRICYSFREYALPYMLYHCVGDFSAYSLCPRELLQLREKSKSSGVDYWGTLEAYLDNNMNIAQTARDLYLHRSSMLGRLERIQEVLGMDLNDPKLQLEYRLIMHLFRLEQGKDR